MAVLVDHEPLETEQMGFRTVGHVLAHVRRENRLVTSLLIDGLEPDLGRIATVRQAPLIGLDLSIKTADPRRMAFDILGEVEVQLDEADRLRAGSATLLRQNQPSRAMEKLSGFFSIWQSAQQTMLKTARLLRVDPQCVQVGDTSLMSLLERFAVHLNDIRAAVERREFSILGDILMHEAAETSGQWREALDAVRNVIEAG